MSYYLFYTARGAANTLRPIAKFYSWREAAEYQLEHGLRLTTFIEEVEDIEIDDIYGDQPA